MEIAKILILFIGLLTITSASPIGLQLLFNEYHRQYNYVVKFKVSCGTVSPSHSESYWTLDARLLVQVHDNFTKVRYRLDELKTSASSQNDGYFSYESPEAAKYLTEPWEVDYQDNGFIKNLYVGSEPVWTLNIKRAISINFQLRKETGTYTNEEPCLYDGCVMTYIAKGRRIKKFNSLRLSYATERSWSSVPDIWIPEYITDIITTAERVYELDDRKGLLTLDLKGNFQYKTHNHILYVSSELSLNYDVDIPIEDTYKLNVSKTTVQYVAHDFSDPSNSIRNRTQEELKNRTYEILLKISSKGIDANNIARNASLIHSLDFIDLLNTMAQLNYASLGKLFEDMVLGTSYDVETSRNIFLEVLPHVRSKACALFVKYLVMEEKEKLEDATILSLIRKLPFNIASHSQQLLEELDVFTKLELDFRQEIRHAAILSYATLVYKTMEARRVKQDYFDNIVVKYFRMYSDCPQYLDRLVWLQGLCNMGFQAGSYTRTIYADSNRDRHERLWSILAGGQNIARQHSVLEMTLPVLMDESEHIQLRVAALHTFLTSDVHASDFIYVHNYIMNSNNNQLKKFWYTTIKSLESSKLYEGYRAASYYVPFILNQISTPDSTYWGTNNYIITTQDDTGAAALQLMSVGDALSGLPTLVGFKISTGGRKPHQVTVYIIMEGVITSLSSKKFPDFNPEVLKVERLTELLRKMKVQVIAPKKVHLDLVIQMYGKTVYATHVNQSRFDTWNGEEFAKSVEDFIRFGSHINQQIVYYPLQTDVNIPTELGTPIRLQSTVMSFTSIRGNLTAPSSHDLTWRNDLHIRYQGTSVTSLSTDGPVLQSEHSALIQQSIVAHLPMKFDVTYSDKFFELKWPNPGAQYGGIAMHSRAQIAIDSIKGRDAYTIKTENGKSEEDETSIFFDCEKPMSGAEVFDKLLTSKSNSYDFWTSLKPSLIILNTILLLTSPSTGPCGVILPPRRLLYPGNNILEAKMQLGLKSISKDGTSLKTTHSLIYREDRPNGDVYMNVSGYIQLEASGPNVTLDVVLTGDQPSTTNPERKWKICFHNHDQSHPTPDQDITNHPSWYEGHIDLTFSHGDANWTCPAAGSQLLIEYKGVPIEMEGYLERHLEVNMFGRELPRLNVMEMEVGSQTPIGQLLSNFDKNTLNMSSIIKEKNGVATMEINQGAEIQFSSENLAWMLDSWTNMQLLKKYALYRECRVQKNQVQTLLGTTEDLPPVQCSMNLAIADCTDTPRFAVVRFKSGGIRIYTGGFFISVVWKGGEPCITRMHEKHESRDCGITTSFEYRVSIVKDAVKIDFRLTDIEVYHYRNDETVILVPHYYMDTSCGSCLGQHYYNMC